LWNLEKAYIPGFFEYAKRVFAIHKSRQAEACPTDLQCKDGVDRSAQRVRIQVI
jgi:hypothetical protein